MIRFVFHAEHYIPVAIGPSLPTVQVGSAATMLGRSVLRLTIQLSEMSVFWHLSLLRMRRKLLTDIDCIRQPTGVFPTTSVGGIETRLKKFPVTFCIRHRRGFYLRSG
nr:hypothetical protein [Solanum melongena]WMB96929.1 hypothetical protein [Solanum melongena]WMB97119.1 hypothetical protein [Solanum aethiopicum]